jgi:hypothetical protein
MSETHHYHKYHDGVPVNSTDPLRARLEKLFAEILEAIDEHAAKPEPEMTDDEIIAKLQRKARYALDCRFGAEDKEQTAFFTLAAKRFTAALAEIKELKEAILDWHVLTNTSGLCDFEAVNRLHEIGDTIRKSRKGGNQ